VADISFIVTFYNKSKFVPMVLNAIFSQKDIGIGEYIFVDDGSTDDTLAQLHTHSEGHQNVKIISQANAGPALATNRGIAEATAPYLKFCDGDDILHPRATSILLQAMQKFDVKMAYSKGEEVPLSSPKMQAPDEPVNEEAPHLLENPLEEILNHSMCNLTCVLATRDAVNAMGGCDPQVFIQDVSFLLRISQQTPFVAVPQILNWCPTDADNRASDLGSGAQVLHDINLAQANLFADYPSIPAHIKARALKRATGRAWKWARRRAGKSFFSMYFLQYVLAYVFPHAGNTVSRIKASCDAFHLTKGQSPLRIIES